MSKLLPAKELVLEYAIKSVNFSAESNGGGGGEREENHLSSNYGKISFKDI